MKNRPLFLVLCMVSIFIVYEASWAGALTIEDRARLGGVYSLETLKKYTEAIPIITDIYKRNPDDLEVKWTYARILGFGGRWKEAAVIFDELCRKGCSKDELMTYAYVLESQASDPETLPYIRKLADDHKTMTEIRAIYVNMLSWGKSNQAALPATGPTKTPQKFIARIFRPKQESSPALEQLDMILKDKPDDENILLSKARILSWHGQLAASVRVYEKLIKDHPDNVLYYREAARVLGWSGRVGEASALYDEACRRFPDNQALKAEAMAKKAYYNNLYWPAEQGYHLWLSLEPKNPEALFDLGQIHANSKQYGAAEKDYQNILDQSPDNPQAVLVRDKARVYAGDWRLEGGFLHDEANSKTRQVDVRLYDAYEHLEKSFLGNMVFGITTDQMEYSFPGPSNVRRQRYAASLEQYFFPDTFWKMGYGISSSSNDNKHLQYRNAEVQFPVLTERLLLNVSYKRDDFIQNEAMLAEHLQQDQYRARATWTPIRPLEIGVDEAHSHFTDGNSLDNFGGDVGWNLLYDPTRLTIRYRWQDWRFKETGPDYFSPSDFPSQRISVEWEQSLNRNDLYWGANGFSYFLRYEFINDTGNQRGNGASAGFKWYINKRLTLKVEAQHISYDHPGIYTDDEQTISLTFVF